MLAPENYRIINPSEHDITEDVRLVVYDNDTSTFIVKEIIKSGDSLELDEKLFHGSWDYKYKFQILREDKWVDHGRYTRILPEKISEDGIKYLLYPNQESEKLLVVFQAINTRQSYNYIKTLKGFDVNKLFIKDDYGLDELTKSSYYLGVKKDLSIAEYTQKLISEVVYELNIKKENLIFAGSSKGGYAALYHGYTFGAGNIIPGGPQIMLGDYLYQTNPASIRYEIFQSIVGDFTEENKSWANNLLYEVMKNSSEPFPNTKVHIGLKEPHYKEHVEFFENWVNEFNIPNVEIAGEDYSTHEELAEFYPIFLNNEVKRLVN
ncbi:hypothetical protein [Salinicoccus sp. HZC-1]|uniref:hypothetical protein n=1 Tax=Salinicoccus sp. HZC-1 TaxID=3385497 RepID=UPI00398AAA97